MFICIKEMPSFIQDLKLALRQHGCILLGIADRH